jgi:IS30 family transposase
MASLRTVERLRDQGMSVRAIAREMKVSKSLVHKSLKNLNAQTQEYQGSEEEKSAVHE